MFRSSGSTKSKSVVYRAYQPAPEPPGSAATSSAPPPQPPPTGGAAQSGPPPAPGMQRIGVKVPSGMLPGQEIQFPTPQGPRFKAVIPPGVTAGAVFLVDVPLSAASVDSALAQAPPSFTPSPGAPAGFYPPAAPSPGLYPSSSEHSGGFRIRAPPLSPQTPQPSPNRLGRGPSNAAEEEEDLARALAISAAASQQQQAATQEADELAQALAASTMSASAESAEREARERAVAGRASGQQRVQAPPPQYHSAGGLYPPPAESAYPPPAPSAPTSAGPPVAVATVTVMQRDDASPINDLMGGGGGGQQHAECPICFDDLCGKPCAVFRRGDMRVCSHSIHEDCARDLPAQHCPLCRAEFSELSRVPLLAEDPEGWFRCVDHHGRSELSKAQVADALVTQFPLDVPHFEKALEKLWPRWDHNGDGSISRAEFFRPEVGLLDFVRTNLLRQKAAIVPVPDIATERLRWFEHFDDDSTGTLMQEELVRALIKTYSLSADLAQVCAT